MSITQNDRSAMDDPQQQDWYKHASSRMVDLVGDIAGTETFIIKGDSILLHFFSSEKLDLAPGFQMLHATYIVEKFLQQLRQRKCIFEIIFFASNSHLCIPHCATLEDHGRYLLAPEAIIHHLASISRRLDGSLKVRKFDSITSHSFLAYLEKSGTYLEMCHDGAFSGNLDQIDSGDNNPSKEEAETSSD